MTQVVNGPSLQSHQCIHHIWQVMRLLSEIFCPAKSFLSWAYYCRTEGEEEQSICFCMADYELVLVASSLQMKLKLLKNEEEMYKYHRRKLV